jgi:fibronectin type 3 domain-containing protein
MMRSLAAFSWAVSLVWIGACVNVDKPAAVVLCEGSDSGCTNRVVDARTGSEAQPGRDAERNSDVKPGSVQDASAFQDALVVQDTPVVKDGIAVLDGPAVQDVSVIPDAETGGSSDSVPDRMQDAAQDLPRDAAQDAARDVATDLAGGPCWGASGPVPSGTVCRKALGPCDVDEVCDGVSAACPPDQYAPATTICREVAGLCDIAESCTGTSPDCPVDAVLTPGTLCRAAAGPCDVAESCSGTDPGCPDDLMAPAVTICRASTDGNHCDPAETCSGSSVSCPADVIYVLPAAPTGVGAVAGIQQATVSWDLVAGATGYNVKRSPTSGSGYTTQGEPPTATAAPYLNTGLTGGTTYYYVVSSVNTISTCESPNSLETSVTPTGACIPPAAPTLTATASNGQVSLTWTASTGATSYTVTRSTTAGTGYLFQKNVTGTSYTDSNVSNGTTYYYVVTANGPSCSSVYSNEASAAPTCTPPAAPTNLAAVANSGVVALTWTASAGAQFYSVSRSTTAGSGYVLLNTPGTAVYNDTAVVNGTTYYYVVTASNGMCNSGYSAEVSATPKCSPPSVPTGLLATPGDGQITLTWTPSTGGAISYLVKRSRTHGGPYTDSSATATSAAFTDTNLIDGTTYYYVVYANGSCTSNPSAEVSAKPVCTPPSAPTNLLASPGDGQVTLSWTAPTTGNVVSYTLTRTTAGADSHTDIPNLKATTYQDSPLTNGTTYSYVVSASNGTCLSVPSLPASATPVKSCNLLAPTGVTVAAGNQQVTISWSAPDAGSLSYVVKRGAVAGGPYATVVPSPNPSGTIDTAVSNGTTYYYVVTASDGVCTSPNSNEVTAKPVCIPPTAPTGVTATANNSNGNITVGWSTVNLATGYTVSRGTSASGPFTAVSTNQTAATFTDLGTGLTAGITYYYVVSACNASGTCVSSNSTPAVSAVSCSSPGVPSGVKATAGIGRVTVSWTASTGGPTSYTVSRRTGTTGSFGVIKTAVTTTSYVDSNVTDGTTYYYEVSAQDAGGVCSSANSGASSAATPRDCRVVSGTTPLAPAPSPGHTGKFNTTGAICFVTCDSITGGFQCYATTSRTIRINGSTVSCGSLPTAAAKTPPYNVIDITAGTTGSDQDEIWWWGTYYAGTCAIPAAGLDF